MVTSGVLSAESSFVPRPEQIVNSLNGCLFIADALVSASSTTDGHPRSSHVADPDYRLADFLQLIKRKHWIGCLLDCVAEAGAMALHDVVELTFIGIFLTMTIIYAARHV